MENTGTYEYRVSCVNNKATAVDASMKQWAEAGWELVSGSASVWIGADPQRGYNVVNTKFAMFWRRLKTTDSAST